MSTIQLFDKFALNVSSPDQKWTSKTSKNTELYTNLEELQPLLDKLR